MASTGERWRAGGDLRLAATRVALIYVWVGASALAVHCAVYYLGGSGVGGDAHAYWLAGHAAHPYGAAPGTMDAYLYSPLFLQVIRPLAWLPWPAFIALWMATEAAAFWWLLKPLGLQWGLPCFLLCVPELLLDNINGLLGLVMVLGFRYAGLWAVPLLTKSPRRSGSSGSSCAASCARWPRWWWSPRSSCCRHCCWRLACGVSGCSSCGAATGASPRAALDGSALASVWSSTPPGPTAAAYCRRVVSGEPSGVAATLLSLLAATPRLWGRSAVGQSVPPSMPVAAMDSSTSCAA